MSNSGSGTGKGRGKGRSTERRAAKAPSAGKQTARAKKAAGGDGPPTAAKVEPVVPPAPTVPGKPAAGKPPTAAKAAPAVPPAPAAPAKPAEKETKPPRPVPPVPLASDAEILAVINADHRDPFGFLGMHLLSAEGPLVVRAFLPRAGEVAVLDAATGKVVATLERLHREGLFAGVVAGRNKHFPYRLRIGAGPEAQIIEDPYRFPPILTEADARLLADGDHFESFDKLGAHPRTLDGVAGVAFAVWAPNTHRVAVIGDFNDWDGRRHGMRLRHECGVWEIFVPAAHPGQLYKYEIKSEPGIRPLEKADPCAFHAERWPGTASIVCDLGRYRWQDEAWMRERAAHNRREAPISIYEVHLGSWRRKPEEDNRWLTYAELAELLPAYVKELGFTHVQLLPISEYNFEGSWGYQPSALYAPTSRFGSPDGFRQLVDRLHAAGIGVIVDWVPVQFPDEPQGLSQFDGRVLYEHPDPRQRHHPHSNTLMYDYGRPEVANYLISNALFWLKRYHIDAIKVGDLARILYLDYGRGPGEWSHNRFGGHENLEAVDFLRRANEVIYDKQPGTFTAGEEKSGWPMVSRPTFLGGLGFGFKLDDAWLTETLRYMARNPIHRKYYHDELTHGPAHMFKENLITALSHDQVVHGRGPLLARMPGSTWDKFANLRLYYAFVYSQPGKKLLFMGNEFAQGREWNHEMSLDWHLLDDPFHRGIQVLVRELNQLYVATPALYERDCEESGFAWIDCNDTEQSVLSYLRFGGGGVVAVVCNFTPVVRHGYRIGVPEQGWYAEKLNTDAARYGGSNIGSAGGVMAEASPMHGRPYSLPLTLPPFAAVVLEHVGERAP